jgi:hypothetical protein
MSKNIITVKNFSLSVNARYFAIAAAVAAKGDVRYYLNGVSVEPGPKGKGAIMVGTDGHRLIAMHDPNGICKQQVILSTSPQMLSACTKSPARSRFIDIMLTLDDNNSLAIGPGGNSDSELQFKPHYRHPIDPRIDGKYTEWRRVVPARDDVIPGIPGGYNGSYLHDFCKIAKLVDGRHGGITFFQHKEGGEHKTLLIRSTGNKDFLGLLMPMRVDGVEGVPAWAAAA